MQFFSKTKRSLALRAAAFVVLGAASLSTQARAQNVYPTQLTNIAAAQNGGRIMNVTSVLDNNAKLGAENLIDGQIYDGARKSGSEGWVSNRFDPINLESVTFGFRDNTLRTIGKIVINPAAAVAPERWAKDVEVQVSTTTAEGPFASVAQLTLKRDAVPQEFTILPTSARFVRLAVRSNWGSDRAVALGEVEMYEAIDKTDGMGQLIAQLESAVNDLKKYRDTQRDINNALGTRTASTQQSDIVTRAFAQMQPANLQLVQALGGAAASVRGNLAAAKNGGKIVDVSSIFNNDPKYGPDNLLDGSNFSLKDESGSFGWASNGFSPSRQWVTVGFRDDRTYVIGKVVLNPVSNQPSLRWASRVDVQVTTGSPTEGPFRTVGTFLIRLEPSNQDFTFRPVEAKYVRFVFTANGPGNPLKQADPDVSSDRSVSLGEIEIYEPPATNDDLESLIGRFNQVLVDLKRLHAQNK